MSDVSLTMWDKIVTLGNPQKQLARYKAKAAIALAGGYKGASKSRRQTANWSTTDTDADGTNTHDLSTLRERSHDLVRNNPLASGILNTKATSVIGSGMKLNANVDEKVLGISVEESKILNKQIENEYELFCKQADLRRTFHFNLMQAVIYNGEKESGDVLINLPMVQRPESPYFTKIQIIEGDRISNPDNRPNEETLIDGVEKDRFGAPKWFHIETTPPGQAWSKRTWSKIKAYGTKTGRKNAIHYYRMKRPNQTRGVPDLAPVIEMFKQLGDFTDAELQAAVISGMFAVMIKTESDADFGAPEATGDTATPSMDIDMSGGVVTQLMPNETIETVSPDRPNKNFGGYVDALIAQIGACLNVPHNLALKKFDSSYSAAKAVLLEAWRYFMAERDFFAKQVLDPIYEVFFEEAVALGRINAPQFLSGDPAIRQALLRKNWKGAARGAIKELEAVQAAKERIDLGLSSIQAETDEMGTGDWEANHQQRVIEHEARKEAGLLDIAQQVITVEDDEDE